MIATLRRARGPLLLLAALLAAAACGSNQKPEFVRQFVPGSEPPPCDFTDPDQTECTAACEEMDADKDGLRDARDPDMDGDGAANLSDNCLYAANPGQEDGDGDGAGDPCDVCPDVADPEQRDADFDGVGDACSPGFDAGGFLARNAGPLGWALSLGAALLFVRVRRTA